MIYQMPYQGQWLKYSDADLKKMKPEDADMLRDLYGLYEKNPFAFFLGHGQQTDFINADEIDFAIMYAPNQVGKTLAMLAWMIRRGIPCKDYWPAFTEHGMKYKAWDGPIRAAMASYTLQTHCRKNMWDKLKLLLPEDELLDYAPKWAKKHNRKPRQINWQTSPRLELACGTVIDFYGYHQSQEAFESMTYDLFAFDEQPKEEQFDGAYARGQTAEHFQACAALTPHYVQGRDDTGSHGWIVKMTTGLIDKGMKWKVYHIGIDDVPDAIVSKRKKEEAYQKHVVLPKKSGNAKKIREGRARYYGIPESSEGLVYDNWDANIHWIDPFPIPYDQWSLYRGIDPGRVHPFAVLWAAITPWDDIVLYREHYESGLGMEDNVKKIIEKSGNRRQDCGVGADDNSDSSIIRRYYEEQYIRERYVFSVMDPRTWAQPARETALNQGQIFAAMGLSTIQGSGMRSEFAIPIVKEKFEPVKGRKHLLDRMGIMQVKDKEGNPLEAAPKIYVFNTLRNFRNEIEGYINKPESELPMDKNNDLMTALKYLVLANPRYMGEKPVVHHSLQSKRREEANRRTGYSGANAEYD